jgi:hypothetical protein
MHSIHTAEEADLDNMPKVLRGLHFWSKVVNAHVRRGRGPDRF